MVQFRHFMKIHIYSTFITVKIYINNLFKNFDQHAFKSGIIKTNLFNYLIYLIQKDGSKILTEKQTKQFNLKFFQYITIRASLV